MFSEIVRNGSRLSAWYTTPIASFRNATRLDSESEVTSVVPMVTSPAVGIVSPASTPRRVDFPHPLGPMIATLDPPSTTNSGQSRARNGPAAVGYSTTRSWTRIVFVSLIVSPHVGFEDETSAQPDQPVWGRG